MPIDYKEYPSNWKTEIRPAILKRAGELRDALTNKIMREAECEECGVKNHSLIWRNGKGIDDWEYLPEGMESEAWTFELQRKATKVILTIAHLDHDKLNHNVDLKRLSALCQKCHLGHDIKHHAANRKYGRKHSENNIKIQFDE